MGSPFPSVCSVGQVPSECVTLHWENCVLVGQRPVFFQLIQISSSFIVLCWLVALEFHTPIRTANTCQNLSPIPGGRFHGSAVCLPRPFRRTQLGKTDPWAGHVQVHRNFGVLQRLVRLGATILALGPLGPRVGRGRETIGGYPFSRLDVPNRE